MTAQEILNKLKTFVEDERQMLRGDSYWGPYDTEAVIAERTGRDNGKDDLLDDLEYILKQIEKEIAGEG